MVGNVVSSMLAVWLSMAHFARRMSEGLDIQSIGPLVPHGR